MPHDHGHSGHSHSHSHGETLQDGPLMWAVVINLALTFAQIGGGWWADSVALMADGVHNLSDALALVLAVGARRLARRPASPQMSFGWGRAEIIAAFVNYLALIVVSVWLMVEAFGRLADPPSVNSSVVIALALFALIVDLWTAWLTLRYAKESMNIRAAYLHNLADAGVSVAVLLGGVLIWAFGWRIADPILTLLISVVILWHIKGDLGPLLRLMMLGAPQGIDHAALRATVTAVPGVRDMHHLHLWQIDERRISAEMHLVVDGDHPAVLRAVKAKLASEFGITHSTIEVEGPEDGCAADDIGDHEHIDNSPDHARDHRH